MDIVVNGKKVGELIQKRSAYEEMVYRALFKQLRDEFQEATKDSKVFKTPIILEEK